MKRRPAGVFRVWQGVVALVGLASLLLYTAFDLPLAFSNTAPSNPLAPLRAPLAADPVDREFRVLELTRGPAEPVELARLELAAGRGREALELAENATEEAPRDAAAWVTLAEAELALGAQEPWRLPRALEAAATALELAPAALDAREAQVRALAALGLTDLARRKAAPLRLEGVEVSAETESFLAELFEPSPPVARPGPVAGGPLPDAPAGTPEAAARRAYNKADEEATDCVPRLEQAERGLARVGSPFAPWGRTKLAICLYYLHRYGEALEHLEKVREVGRRGGDAMLEARALWLTGLIEAANGRYEVALAAYGQAVELFEAAGEPGHAAYVHLLEAKSLRLSGRVEEAWLPRRLGLEAVAQMSPDRRFSLLDEVADALLTDGFPRAGALFAAENRRTSEEEVLRGTGAADNPIWASLDLADAFTTLGFRDSAFAAAHAAANASAHLAEDYALRPWLEAAAEAARAEAEGDPAARHAAAVALIAIVEPRVRVAGVQLDPRDVENHVRAYRREAAALRDLGRLAEAEHALGLALGRVESLLAELGPGNAEAKGLFVAGYRQLFTDLTRLQALDLADPEAALETVEHARNRGLLEQVAALRGMEAGRVRSAAEIRAGFAGSRVLVEYARLGEELGVWTVAGGVVHFEALPLTRPALRRLVEPLRPRNSAEVPPPEPVEAAVAALLPGVLAKLPPEAELVVVPSPELYAVPFAGLVAVSRPGAPEAQIAPSASFYLGGARPASAEAPVERVLLVINPAFSHRVFPRLEPLPLARQQGECLKQRYPGATALEGAAATPSAVLAALPRHSTLNYVGHALAPGEFQNRGAGLALAPESSEPFTDGFLSADAVAAKDLTGLERVFLDACNTGHGTRARGQEMASLATAFLAAGAGRVKASLVPVLDSAVRQLDGRVGVCGGEGAGGSGGSLGEEKGFVWQTFSASGGGGGER